MYRVTMTRSHVMSFLEARPERASGTRLSSFVSVKVSDP
jgi:hypothetical protein